MSIILISNNLLNHPSASASMTGELAAYPGENLRVHHPTEFCRTGTPSSTSNAITLNLGTFRLHDVVALLYTNLTAHPCLVKQSHTLNTTWTKTNCSITYPALAAGRLAVDGMSAVNKIDEGGSGGEHKISQGYTVPESTNTDYTFTVWAYCWQDGPEVDEVFLYMSNGSDTVKAEFDLTGTGTAQTPSTTGSDWSATTSSISMATPAVGTENLYIVELTGTAAKAFSTLTAELRLGNGSGSDSYTGTSRALYCSGVCLNMGSSRLGWADSSATTGAVYSFPDGNTWGNCFKTDERDRQRQQGWVHGPLINLSSPISDNLAYVYVNDVTNVDGFIQVSDAAIGLNVAGEAEQGLGHGYNQRTSDQWALGGELYRPENEAYRKATLAYEFLNETDRGQLDRLDRTVLSSRGLMLVIDPENSEFLHDRWIYGVQNLQPFQHKTWSKTLNGNAWRRGYEVVEVIP